MLLILHTDRHTTFLKKIIWDQPFANHGPGYRPWHSPPDRMTWESPVAYQPSICLETRVHVTHPHNEISQQTTSSNCFPKLSLYHH